MFDVTKMFGAIVSLVIIVLVFEPMLLEESIEV